jgi:hypothetical protein
MLFRLDLIVKTALCYGLCVTVEKLIQFIELCHSCIQSIYMSIFHLERNCVFKNEPPDIRS